MLVKTIPSDTPSCPWKAMLPVPRVIKDENAPNRSADSSSAAPPAQGPLPLQSLSLLWQPLPVELVASESGTTPYETQPPIHDPSTPLSPTAIFRQTSCTVTPYLRVLAAEPNVTDVKRRRCFAYFASASGCSSCLPSHNFLVGRTGIRHFARRVDIVVT